MPYFDPQADHLRGRTILVTGAGDGIGRVAAQTYARYGAEVILLGRTVSKLEGVYDQIVKAGGVKPAVYPLNLIGATAQDYRDLAEVVADDIGHLDGILHNAAMLELLTPLEYHPVEVWEHTLRANLTAPFLLTQACLPLLKASPDSAVIFSTDECASTPKGYWGAYAASKAGIQNVALMWAQELSDTSVRVNLIDSGPARTAMRHRTHPGEVLTAWPTPEELMSAYLYFIGPDSKGQRGSLVKAADWNGVVLDFAHDNATYSYVG